MDKLIKTLTRDRIVYIVLSLPLLLFVLYTLYISESPKLLQKEIYQKLEPLRQPLADVQGGYDSILLVVDLYIQAFHDGHKLVVILLLGMTTIFGSFIYVLTDCIKKIRIEQKRFNDDSEST